MRFFSTIALATLSASGIVTAMPVAYAEDVSPSLAQSLQEEAAVGPVDVEASIETRANTPADDQKHDANHEKIKQNNCGTNCHKSLDSYHSQASKDSKASKASKASKNSKNGGRDLKSLEAADSEN
ncbi:uncharacterized protein CTRU02_205691 [Colletotrichum truncatum]|uniref:Uncharacterized protein n=1 Tax=Colletotrichum truncatum TaxID=5467 RepID=A0ACC3Z4Q8_COLTU|nr:uncharacterized protein CTRU02_09444 [Colletotrichum truncatum]KAF6788636.1 hypothetical protein CTRU02_09444 [Colletotrichum truncatum]